MITSAYPTKTLSDYVQFKTGKLDSNAAVEGGEYAFFTCSRDTFRTNTYAFDQEAVLLAGNNAAGKFPIKYFKGKFDAYQRTYVISPKNHELVNTRYIYYSLIPLLDSFRTMSTGTTTKFLTKTILDRVEIPLPSKDTQDLITHILAAYDDLIENNLKRIAILETMSLLMYRHISNTEDSEEWIVQPFSQIADFINGYAFKPSDWKDEGLPIIKIRELKNGITRNTPKYNGELKDKYKVHDRDILFSWSADLNVYIWQEGEAWLNQHLFNVVPHSEFSKTFLYYALMSKMEDFRAMSNGTTMKHIKRSALDAVKIKIPPKEIRGELDIQVKPALDLILNLKRSNNCLIKSRNLLLPRLMSGEIEV